MISGSLLVHHDFLGDDLPFQIDLGGGEGGVPDHVAEDVYKEGKGFRVTTCLVNGLLLAGECVQGCADIFRIEADVPSVTADRSLEGHVLDEVGDALVPGWVVTASGRNVD